MTNGEKAAIRMIRRGVMDTPRGRLVRQAIIERSGWERWTDLLAIADRLDARQTSRSLREHMGPAVREVTR